MEDRWDVIVIGAGNAGRAAAHAALAAGKRTLLVERREVGGTCPLRGCVPKKVLVAAAEVLDAISRAERHHIHVGRARLDWRALIERERSFVDGVPEEMEESERERGITVAHGTARFVDPHAVRVGERVHRAEKLVVATGAVPHGLAFEGASHLVTSEDLLEMRDLPGSIAFVGAGVVALEFSHVLARAGARVTLLEASARPLERFDPDAVALLVEESRRIGIRIETDVTIDAVAAQNGGFTVRYRQHGERRELAADTVANGAGRSPDYGALDLERAGVALDDGKPRLDGFLRSLSNPDVGFAGDAVPGTPQLSPLATRQGTLAVRNLLGPGLEHPDYRSVPAVVFTIPALARVGLSEAEARERGLDVELHCERLEGWRSGRTAAESVSFAKILVDKATGTIAGAHLLGHGAQETINALALHIRYGVPADQLRETVFAYPTFHADLEYLV